MSRPIILSDYHRRTFWSRVAIGNPDECWPWTRKTNSYGYGFFGAYNKTQIASRVAWYLANGREPDGVVCHSCDNPVCCNPRHLFVGTQGDNIRDCVRKGRHKETRKTHCPSGHEYTPENTTFSGGARYCRKCNRLKCQRTYEKRKARAA